MFRDRISSAKHLSEDLLIRFLDGELPAPDATRAKIHLASCWACRGRIQEFEQAVQCFLEYRMTLIERMGEPKTWLGFRSRLDRQASEFRPRSRSYWPWWAAACVAVAGLGALLIGWPLWQEIPSPPMPAATVPGVPSPPQIAEKSRRSPPRPVRPQRAHSTFDAIEPGLIPGAPFLGDVTAQSSIARDTKGRIAQLQEGRSILILDPTANAAYAIDHEKRVAQQTPLSLALRSQWAVLPRLTNVRREEPPGSLFEIPEGFAVQPFKRKKIPIQSEGERK